MSKQRLLRTSAWIGTASLAVMLSCGPAGAQPADAEQRIEALEQQLNAVLQQLQAIQQELEETRSTAEQAGTTATQAQAQAEAMSRERRDPDPTTETTDEPVVSSAEPRVKLAISGQVNRAVNFANDGDLTDVYFVDNDVSNSRVRFVGTGELGDGTTLGSRIEFAISPNNSSDVSQDNEDAGDFFDERRVEIFARNDAYGQLSFGKGNAASEDTAEYDLSLVAGPIMYSGVADPVGGLQFTSGGALTGITVGDAFFNFDGLGRQNRVRYDTPNFGPGIQLSASVAADQRWDVAATWGGDFGDWSGVEAGDFLTLAAVAVSDPNNDGTDLRFNGSASVLHLPTGLSATVSGGMDHVDGDNPFNLYGKLAWDTEFFDFGPTGFGVDYTYGKNVCDQCDTGNSVGLAGVQVVEEWGLEFYSQYRWFNLDTQGGAPDVKDIHAVTIGSRAKF